VANLPSHALSLYAPWCWAILFAGKDVENREWKPWNPATKFRGRFWIHASMFGGERGKPRQDLQDACESVISMAPPTLAKTLDAEEILRWSLLARGKIVGSVEVTSVVDKLDSTWFCGPLGLVLASPRPLEVQIQAKGLLGFWSVPEAKLVELRTQRVEEHRLRQLAGGAT
jgi:hypothetical protein